MEYIFSFKLNQIIYKVYEVDKIYDDETTVGLTEYQLNKILLKKLDTKLMIRTLKHELTHIWLYEFGHNQDDENKTFNYEDVCEIVACSNDFINTAVKAYKQVKGVENGV